ncbi:MAG TPA: flavodoxin domain-containing protein, partial [Candidatus Rifleibacterium sp.]|nr:flavodoxin domain-containing protein [Candidatus Rifleibacterium sp.]
VQWATGEPQKSALIIFDTIWGGTEKMARAIAEGLEDEGVSYRMFNAGAADLADTMTDFLSCRALVVGCPTRNNKLLPTLALYMEEISGLRFKNKIGMAFGTYGWSGEAVKRLETFMQEAGIEVVIPGYKCQFAPSQEDLAKCREMGRELGQKIKAA